MSGVGNDHDLEVAARLARGFAAARSRSGDEVMRRRVWGKVATPPPLRERAVRPWLPGVGLLVVGAAALAVWWSPGVAPPGQGTGAPVVARSSGGSSRTLSNAFPQPLTGPVDVRTGAGETLKVRLRGGTRLALAGDTDVAVGQDDRPTLRAGRIRLEVPKQAPGSFFAVTAGPYQVVVIGTRFGVELDQPAGRVGVEVEEGQVEIRRGSRVVRLAAGQSWSGLLARTAAAHRSQVVAPPDAPSLVPAPDVSVRSVALPQPVAPPSALSLSRQAHEAVAAGDPRRALELLGILARRPGPSAQNAIYESGRVLRDHLAQPRQAIEVWRRYRERFPGGMLRAEVDLSIVETYARLSDTARALEEADAFVRRHPRNERRAEIAALARALREGRAVAPR